jgi:hypothetical protein
MTKEDEEKSEQSQAEAATAAHVLDEDDSNVGAGAL